MKVETMANTQLSAPLTKEQAFELVDAVMEREDLALSASAHEDDDGGWVFEATCHGKPDLAAFDSLASDVLGGSVGFSSQQLDPDVDWVAKSLEGLKPVSAGGFFVYGSHDEEEVPTGQIPILIDAAQAFGTGHHETTTGCLEAISQILKFKKPHSMLDVGTGTGILAIALAKRIRRPVIASDIDPVCVTTTKANARQNHVTKNVVAVEAAGLNDRLIANNGPYDLIVANILAGPLAKLAPDMGQAAMPGGSLILSGILVSQAARIKAAYGHQGFVFKNQLTRKNWVTLIFEKARVPKRRL